MYEQEPESDEDCEVYFLKPVNEYNIVDKIKEANKELFAAEDDADATATVNSNNRKVTFALNLENYEPATQVTEQAPPISSPPEELLQQLAQLKLTECTRIEAIAEEEPGDKPQPQEDPTEMNKHQESEDEICEEIFDLSVMETMPTPTPIEPEASLLYEDEDFSGEDEPMVTTVQPQQRLERQNTFDCHFEQPEEGESDQKSLTNLLNLDSDGEEQDEERTLNEARLKLQQAYKSLYKTLDADEQAKLNQLTDVPRANGQEDTEDDDLSIIVASYIPKNFELNKRSIYYKSDEQTEKQLSVSPSHIKTKNFFSFRRRATPKAPAEQTAVPDVKLNYKICCEHRHALQDKLPRYTGYMSEYGLSEQQLLQRDQQARRKQRCAMEQTLNRNEQELKKMQDNERAFTTWLKNKMRYPINKTRNMFDATRRRSSVAAVSSRSPTLQQQEQHYHQHPRRRRDSNEVHTFRHLLGSWNK
ncbi:CG13924 [Drosophila busckii]|uniref:Coiled-coil domain-containing protein 181 n=1 Tax=Drosophila busckii TaxID=30019 RepID=A0A0M4EJJ9_DROBS|nr:uncharacterized protein LOC108600719 [Drosophila busckii]ALC43185.1 CG13924 [Drosophila busckii]